MKKFLFIIFISLFFVMPLEAHADFDAYVRRSGSTTGGVTYTLYKDGKVIFSDKLLSAPTYSATVDGYSGSLEAYCLQSELDGPESGAWYTCVEGAGDDYGAILNAGTSGGLTQQEIEYALKVAAAEYGDTSGVIVSGSSSADSDGYPIYQILAAAGTSAIGKKVSVVVDGVTYEVEINDPKGTYSSAMDAKSGSGTVTSNTFKIVSKDISCSGSSCTATIKYSPTDTKVEVTATSGKVSVSKGTISITGINAKDGCGSTTVTIKYTGASGWARCSAKVGSTTMQNMIIESPSSGSKKITLSSCDDSNCNVQGSAVNSCVSEAEIKESDYFKTCILDQNDCIANPHNVQTISNQFCKIACKEDIKMEFPTTILGANGEAGKVFSGRYFTLNTVARVEGKKTCVTGGIDNINIIDWESFLKKVYGSTTENAYGGLNKVYRDSHNQYVVYDYLYNHLASASKVSTTSETCCLAYKDGKCSNEVKTNVDTYRISYSTSTFSSSATYEDVKNDNCLDESDNYNEVLASLDASRTSALASRDAAKASITDAFRDIKQCTEFNQDDINYQFNPEMTFEYPEPYSSDVGFTVVSSSNPTITETQYCNTAATDLGFVCGGGGTTHENVTVYNCTGTSDCTSQARTLEGIDLYYYKNKAVKKVLEASKEWSNTTYFFTIIPSGAITTTSSEGSNTVAIGTVYPVSISTPAGGYEYTITVTNLGENNKFDTCVGESILACPYEVVNDIVTPPNKPGGGGGNEETGINFFYRPIVLEDVFPNSNTSANGKKLSNNNFRIIGSNWSSQKGEETEKEIEKKNNALPAESIYNQSNVEYSYTITPLQMARIRRYNKQQEEVGGYADFTLTCSEDGLECKSSFLNSENGSYFTDNLNNSTSHRNVSFMKWEDGTAWK